MAGYSEQIKDLEDQLRKTKYNKKTQHHIGLVKAKLAKLKEKETSRGSKKSVHHGYSVRRAGDATVILIGFPSAGKSTLLNALTNANSVIGDYEFTTLDVIPGTMEYKQSKIQILDVPGIVKGAASGKGRGREVLSCMMNADLIIVVVDVTRPAAMDVILKEIYDTHVRLNKKKPDVRIRKTIKNGIRIGRTVRTPLLDDETIITVLKEFRIRNADVLIRSPIDVDAFIDVLEGNKRYIPSFVLLTKIDLVTPEQLEDIKKKIHPDVCISAHEQKQLDDLKDIIFDKLEFIRVFCKEVGKKADMGEPLILQDGATLKTMCQKLHKDFVSKFKFARVWGPSAKFAGQKLMKKTHKLKDTDVVELHIR